MSQDRAKDSSLRTFSLSKIFFFFLLNILNSTVFLQTSCNSVTSLLQFLHRWENNLQMPPVDYFIFFLLNYTLREFFTYSTSPLMLCAINFFNEMCLKNVVHIWKFIMHIGILRTQNTWFTYLDQYPHLDAPFTRIFKISNFQNYLMLSN